MDITAQQASILERLRIQGFQIVAFPMFESYVGVRKGNCAALLAPQGSDAFGIYGHASFLVDGNFSAKILDGDGHYFVAKREKVKATPERNTELEKFEAELAQALLPTA
jgi:hypothetical protein